jgi:hypothetical protein
MIWMSTRPATHLLDGSAVAKRKIEGIPKCVANESKRIQEIALPRPVGANEEHEAIEINSAGRDTLIVSDRNSTNERGSHAIPPQDYRLATTIS